MSNPNIDILYEDDSLLIINKPAGALTHPKSLKSKETTLQSLVRPFTSLGKEQRYGIVHRLDRETSGVLAVAKTDKEYLHLKQLFKERKISKFYLAIVEGVFRQSTKRIDLPLRRSPTYRLRRVVSPAGKQAITDIVKVVSNNKNSALLLKPLTGRTNQIRAHLSHVGHPIAFDTTYGAAKGGRTMLHALAISFATSKGVKISISAPIPKDFLDIADKLGLDIEELENVVSQQ